MGEGWSDFLALVMTARGATSADQDRGFATYSIGEPPDGPGWRGAPYSPNLSVNSWTYRHWPIYPPSPIGDTEHSLGGVWAAMLWEVYWNLVREHGFNSDLYEDWSTGGNNLALRLVLDGMKLTPCSPGFVDARNAILLADQNLTGGTNQCLIWRGFAKRGLGANANQGSANVARDGTEDFTVPASACGPVEAHDPTSLSASLVVGTSQTQTFNVSNVGLAGADNLQWTVGPEDDDCGNVLDWLTVTPDRGIIAQGATTTVSVTINATGLTPGQTYTAALCGISDGLFLDPPRPGAPIVIPVSVRVEYAFAGFSGGLTNPPTLNTAKAGTTVPVKFGLTGNWGLNVLAGGSPASQQINCTTKATIGAPSPVSLKNALSYDATLDRYTYTWKTDKAYVGTCRQFILRLNDGSAPRTLYFKF
jgi:hypothetical protein